MIKENNRSSIINKITKLTCIVFSVLVSLPAAVKAQDEVVPGGYTRAQVLKTTGLSAALSIAAITSTGFIDSTQIADVDLPGWFYGIIALEHIPLYALEPAQGIKHSAIQAGLLGAHLAARYSVVLSLY